MSPSNELVQLLKATGDRPNVLKDQPKHCKGLRLSEQGLKYPSHGGCPQQSEIQIKDIFLSQTPRPLRPLDLPSGTLEARFREIKIKFPQDSIRTAPPHKKILETLSSSTEGHDPESRMKHDSLNKASQNSSNDGPRGPSPGSKRTDDNYKYKRSSPVIQRGQDSPFKPIEQKKSPTDNGPTAPDSGHRTQITHPATTTPPPLQEINSHVTLPIVKQLREPGIGSAKLQENEAPAPGPSLQHLKVSDTGNARPQINSFDAPGLSPQQPKASGIGSSIPKNGEEEVNESSRPQVQVEPPLKVDEETPQPSLQSPQSPSQPEQRTPAIEIKRDVPTDDVQPPQRRSAPPENGDRQDRLPSGRTAHETRSRSSRDSKKDSPGLTAKQVECLKFFAGKRGFARR